VIQELENSTFVLSLACNNMCYRS